MGFWEVFLPERTLRSEEGRTANAGAVLDGKFFFSKRGQYSEKRDGGVLGASLPGCTPWQGLLLTAFLLTSWFLPTTVQVTIELVPPQVAEGENVLIIVYSLPEDLTAIAWFKGVTNMNLGIALYALASNISVKGPEHSGRETVFSNGSLLLHNVTQKDTGFYTIRTLNRHGKIVSTTSIYLHVYTFFWTCGPLSPYAQLTIESVPPKVAEGGSVLLVVHNLQGNLRSLFWYKGMIVSRNLEVARHIIDTNLSVHGPLHSGRETIYSNGSLMFYNVTWKDSGLYTLRTLSTDMKTELAHVQLQVDASLSPCCNPLTSSQLMIEPVPRYAVEGESVLFMVHNLPKDLQTFSWYKSVYGAEILKITEYSRAMSSTTRGSELRRRERVYTNGFLLLQNATEKDAGMYILETLSRDFKIEKAQVQLYVNKPVSQPFIRVTNTMVTIQSSVVLTCLSADTGIFIHWIFNNQSLQLTERMTLSPTKCQLSIDPVRKEDAGEYQCEVSNPVSSQTSLPVSLAVTN